MTVSDETTGPVTAAVIDESPLIAAWPGAVANDPTVNPIDAGVALHYGDPLREQRTLHAGAGVVDLSHFGVVTVTGDDRRSWLHSLLSQHVEHLEPGVGTEALLLSPNGHVEQHVRVVDDGQTTWLITEPSQAAAFADFLDRMRFMLRVEVANVSDEYAVLWLPNEARAAELADNSVFNGSVVVPARRGAYVVVPRERLAEATQSVGDPAGTWAYEALRVAAGEPRLFLDTDHRTIPHEVDWIAHAVHLQKGCYRGQETVARVHNLGRPPRRLVLLHLDGSTNHLPEHGVDVTVDDRRIGFIGTAVHHFELGPIALAVVKRAVDPSLTLLADGVSAAQEVIVEP